MSQKKDPELQQLISMKLGLQARTQGIFKQLLNGNDFDPLDQLFRRMSDDKLKIQSLSKELLEKEMMVAKLKKELQGKSSGKMVEEELSSVSSSQKEKRGQSLPPTHNIDKENVEEKKSEVEKMKRKYKEKMESYIIFLLKCIREISKIPQQKTNNLEKTIKNLETELQKQKQRILQLDSENKKLNLDKSNNLSFSFGLSNDDKVKNLANKISQNKNPQKVFQQISKSLGLETLWNNYIGKLKNQSSLYHELIKTTKISGQKTTIPLKINPKNPSPSPFPSFLSTPSIFPSTTSASTQPAPSFFASTPTVTPSTQTMFGQPLPTNPSNITNPPPFPLSSLNSPSTTLSTPSFNTSQPPNPPQTSSTFPLGNPSPFPFPSSSPFTFPSSSSPSSTPLNTSIISTSQKNSLNTSTVNSVQNNKNSQGVDKGLSGNGEKGWVELMNNQVKNIKVSQKPSFNMPQQSQQTKNMSIQLGELIAEMIQMFFKKLDDMMVKHNQNPSYRGKEVPLSISPQSISKMLIAKDFKEAKKFVEVEVTRGIQFIQRRTRFYGNNRFFIKNM